MSDDLFSSLSFDNTSNKTTNGIRKNNGLYEGGANVYMLKVYLMVIMAGYFIVKIVYPLFYRMFPQIQPNQEITNLGATLILSTVSFILTNFWQVQVHWSFYLGMILGINYPALYHRLLSPTTHNTLSEQETQKIFGTLLYVKVIGISLFLLYAAIVSPRREVYLLYLGGIILLVMGVLYVSYGRQTIELGLSFTAWVLSLFYLFTPQTTTMSIFFQLFFGMTLGTFVGNMSYLGPDYVFQQSVTSPAVSPTSNTSGELDFSSSINGIRWSVIILVFFNILLFVLYFIKQ